MAHESKMKPKPEDPQQPLEAAESWLVQCPVGLAPMLEKELIFAGALQRADKPLVRRQRNHDLIFLNRARKTEGMASLRISQITLSCPAYGRFKFSKRQLDLMARTLIALSKASGPRRLVVAVTGKQFQRHDLLRFVTREMAERQYHFDEDVENEVWIFCVDESWYFGLPATKARNASGRSERLLEREGSLPAPIAAALAFASVPKNDDVVWDPTCGSGTLLAEFHSYQASAQLFGCDIDPDAVAIARKNAPAATIVVGDSSRDAGGAAGDGLGGAAGGLGGAVKGQLTLTLANLPFGKQFGSRETNRTLYESLLRKSLEYRASDRPWRGIFLTSDTENFTLAVQTVGGLISEKIVSLAVRGESATVYRVKPRS